MSLSPSAERCTALFLNLCGQEIFRETFYPWLVTRYLPLVSSCLFSSQWPESVRLYEGPLQKLVTLTESQEQLNALTTIIYHFPMLHAAFGHVQ